MRKIYMRMTVVALCLLATLGVVAQTTGYAITSNTNNNKCNIIAFDTEDPSVVTETVWTDTAYASALMGTLAEDIYYVYMANTDENNSSTWYTFNSINMTTGVNTLLNKIELPSNGHLQDICYDAVTKELYGVRTATEYDDEGNSLGTSYQLCTIHPSTGVWTEFVTLPEEWVNTASASYYLGPICADGNGGIYVMGANRWLKGTGNAAFWSSYINLYRIDLSTKETSVIYNLSEETVVKVSYSNIVGAGVKSTMELHEGKLYIIGNNNFLVMDVATGAVTKSAKNFTGEPVGLCFAKSTADGTPAYTGEEEQPDTRVVKVVETYGDHMGERTGVMTHKTISLYDGNNRLQREATYGYSYTSEWEIEYFKTYTYNEEGLLSTTSSEKYGIYDGTDLAFMVNNDTVSYKYDEAGRLIEKTMQADGYSMVYEYDAEGHLVKEIKLLPDYYNQYEGDYYAMNTYTYSAFNEFGLPDSVYYTALYDPATYGIYTYDAKGRKIAHQAWTASDDVLTTDETWTYNDNESNDTVMVYWSHSFYYGFDMGESRTVYTYDNGNTNRTKEQAQTLANGVWVNEATYTITELSEMNPDAVATLAVSPLDGGMNSVALELSLPDVAVTGTIAFDVYRHGMLLTRLNMTDAENGKLTYNDVDVKNGTYDYYVQTVLVNELLETEEALNISNVVTYTFDTQLPAVQEIWCTSVREESGIWYATIEWMIPTFIVPTALDYPTFETYGFQRYNVMLENMKAADNNEADGQALTWEVNCGSTGIVNLYIQTVYTYGKANSEMISIDCKALGIETTEAAAVAVTVNNGVVATAAPAKLTAYNVQGAVVAEAACATTLDLHTLPAGIYLVTVEADGVVKTVKVRI